MWTSPLLRTAVSRRVPAVASRRCLSSPADTQHRPVIQLHGLHARYANATYTAASKAGVLDQVEKELGQLAAAASVSPTIASFLENPLIGRNAKAETVAAMTKGKMSNITENLLTTLAGNARLNEFPKVASTFADLMKARRGEVDATIISAEPLAAAAKDAIAKAMKSQVPADKTVVLQTKVDPSILGGLQVQIGDQFLDLSIKSRIEEISRTSI